MGEHESEGGAGLEQEHLAFGGWVILVEDGQRAEQDDRHVQRHRVGLAPHGLVRPHLGGEPPDGTQAAGVD